MAIKVSVIGSGGWGKVLIGKFHGLTGVHLVYGHQNRESLQTDYGVSFTEDIDQLIEESDAVVLASPPPTHHGLSKRVLDANRDLFLEKPMALTTEDAQEIAKLADDKRRILLIGHILCYSTAYQRFQELPGEIVSASAAFLKTSTNEQVLNAHWNFGVHMVALALALGAKLDQFELQADDQADHNQRTFTLVKQSADGQRHTLTWDFLAPENKEDMLLTECQHFLDRVADREQPLTHGWHGVEVTEAMQQISPEYRK